MAITEKDVLHVAKLSRLSLSNAEAASFTAQLDGIIGFIGKLNEVDVTDIEPTASILDAKNVVRPDTTRKDYATEEMLKNAPDREGDLFAVPKIIE